MKIIYSLICLSFLISFTSCEEDTTSTNQELTECISIELNLSTAEYHLYNEDRKRAFLYINEISETLEQTSLENCAYNTGGVEYFSTKVNQFSKQIFLEDTNVLLEKLRDLKGNYISSLASDDFDLYLYHMWLFEMDMNLVSETAMDPMLDLYEWNEFQIMVDCMNESWNNIQLHHPNSMEIIQAQERFHQYSAARMGLERAVNQFNKAVASDDYNLYDLCDHGMDLRMAYITYLKELILPNKELEPFLATL